MVYRLSRFMKWIKLLTEKANSNNFTGDLIGVHLTFEAFRINATQI